MSDRIKMDETAMAKPVDSTFGVSSTGGTPGKASGNDTPDRFDAVAINSEEERKPFPSGQEPYWNSNNLKMPS